MLAAALAFGLLPVQTGRLSWYDGELIAHHTAQFLAASMLDNEDCSVVASVNDLHSDDRFLAFNSQVQPEGYKDYDDALSHALELTDDSCVLFYRSLSCGLVGGAQCPRPAGEVVAEQTVSGERYSFVPEYGALPGENHLEFIRLDLGDAGGQ